MNIEPLRDDRVTLRTFAGRSAAPLCPPCTAASRWIRR